MGKLRIIAAILACTALCLTVFSGCASKGGGQGQSKNHESEKEKPVELSFYIQNSPVNDMSRILEKANKIIEEEIGAKLNLIMVEKATYAEKVNLMITSGDYFDICFTASYGGINFYENADNGAYADLTDIIPKYAPKSYERIPERLWDDVKVNGKIYAVVNYQQWGVAQRKGFRVRKDIADELNFDWKSVKGKPAIEALNLLEPFIGKALAKHPDMIGWETSANISTFASEPLLWDMENIGDLSVPGWIRFTQPSKVINQFETKEFADYCNIMRDWYNKGYIRKDGATVKDINTDRKNAKLVAEVTYAWPDSVDFDGNMDASKMSMCTIETAPAYTVSTTRTVTPAGSGSAAATAINAKSKNIEKSLQLIELLNTHDDLYLLLTQGEEGVDYVYNKDGSYSQVEGKFNFNFNEWQIGQSYSPDFTRTLYNKNEDGKKQKESQSIVYKADREAEASPITGFIFDSTKVTTQIANCSSIITEMVTALSSGSVDPKKALPEFLQRLKAAGVDDIISEKQLQLNAFKASKKNK